MRQLWPVSCGELMDTVEGRGSGSKEGMWRRWPVWTQQKSRLLSFHISVSCSFLMCVNQQSSAQSCSRQRYGAEHGIPQLSPSPEVALASVGSLATSPHCRHGCNQARMKLSRFQLWNYQVLCNLGHPLQCTCLETWPELPQTQMEISVPQWRMAISSLQQPSLGRCFCMHTLPRTPISRPAFCKPGPGDFLTWRQSSRKQTMHQEILLSDVVLRGAAERSSAIRALHAP